MCSVTKENWCIKQRYFYLLFVNQKKRDFITARKRSCGKVMFLHLSVCSQGGGRSCDVTSSYGQHLRLPGQHLSPPQPPPINKWAVGILLECFLITTCKWSLGQGNVFTPVCHSVHGSGGGLSSQHASQVTWPGGYASRGVVCIQGMSASGGSASRGLGTPWALQDTVNKRTVRILLENILV